MKDKLGPSFLSGLKCVAGAHVLCRLWIVNSSLSSLTPWATAKNDRVRSKVTSQAFGWRNTFVGVVLGVTKPNVVFFGSTHLLLGAILMSEQLEKIEKELQNGSTGGQNEQVEGLWRRLWDHEALFSGPSPPQGEFYHFQASILESVLGLFWKILEIKFASSNWAGFWCVLGIDFCCKREGFCHQFETKTR